MSEIKTVTHEGKVYQLNKDYFFGNYKRTLKLIRIDIASEFPFRVFENGIEDGYARIYLGSAEFGTITPAPIELEHGKAYTFDHGDNKHVVGVYDNKDDDFIGADDCFESRDCTNIRLMTVESK
jgi:hypothetical protein